MSNSPNDQELNSNILLAMALLLDDKIDFDRIIDHLRTYWGATVTLSEDNDNEASDTVIVFDVNDHMVALALMPCQVPMEELATLYPYAFLWPEATMEVPQHKTHVIVSIMSDDASALERYTVLTKVSESVLAETNSLGLYQGNQTLLVDTETYLGMAQALLEESLPFLLWVFVGLRGSDNANSLYTYGMNGFDKLEMEIINSKQDMEELFDFMINIGCYVITNDVTFQAGETLGYTESKDARIEISPGHFLDGDTIKIVM